MIMYYINLFMYQMNDTSSDDGCNNNNNLNNNNNDIETGFGHNNNKQKKNKILINNNNIDEKQQSMLHHPYEKQHNSDTSSSDRGIDENGQFYEMRVDEYGRMRKYVQVDLALMAQGTTSVGQAVNFFYPKCFHAKRYVFYIKMYYNTICMGDWDVIGLCTMFFLLLAS
eukprot:UN04413